MKSRPAAKTFAPCLLALAIAHAFAAAPAPDALPTGGRVTAGSAAIAQSGTRMDVTQTTQRAILEWQRFDIGSGAQVNFAQPNASAIALNRVLAGEASQIQGRLSANGQVFLINPAGIVFGTNSRVDVGGMVAATLDIKDSDFLAGRNVFTGNGGAVLNQGKLTAADGGYIALLAPEVRNEGVIVARLGTVALAAGNKVTLDLQGDGLLGFTVDAGAVRALAENNYLIQADGGQVLLSARAANEVASAVINNPGTIQARTLENHNGVIKLLGDMEHGTVNVGGLLDASAPSPLAGEGRGEGANGGHIETSAAHVNIAPDAHVTTAAQQGKTGTWLIDPNDYTIAAAGGDITGAQLGTNLNSNNITILSSQGATAGNGDIFVNDAVSWTSANALTLSAVRNIAVNQNLTSTGGGSVVLRADSSGTSTGTVSFAAGKTISLTGGSGGKTVDIYYNPSAYTTPTSYSGKVTAGTLTSWMLVNDVNQLQAMNTNLSGNYALGKDIDASATATWNANGSGGYYGFAPVGNTTTWFAGKFDGDSHVIDRLTINRPSTDIVGLFGYAIGATLRNVGLTQLFVSGRDTVGGLAACNCSGSGAVSNSYSTGTIFGRSQVGGLVGGNISGTVGNSYSTSTVVGSLDVGGVVGYNTGGVSNSYSTGAISGSSSVGGLVGSNNTGNVSNSYSTGTVNGSSHFVGGLVGQNGGTVSNSHYDVDQVTINGQHYLTIGGLYDTQYQDWIGHGRTLTIADYAATLPLVGGYYSVSSVQGLKDLLGFSDNAAYKFRLAADIDMSSAPGLYIPSFAAQQLDGAGHVVTNLSISQSFGFSLGFIGQLKSGASVTNLGVTGVNVSGYEYVGALVGWNQGTVNSSYSTGSVSGVNYALGIGGLVGKNDGTISNSYSTASVGGSGTYYVGGLVGINAGAVGNSYTTGAVGGSGSVGGLVGDNTGTVSNSYWNTESSGKATSAAGTGLTAAQMTQQDSYSGWDFTNAWRIVEGQTYPGLLVLVQPLTVTANDAAKTYDGLAYAGSNGVRYSLPGVASLVFGTAAYGGSTNAGSYAITPSGLVSAQYDLTFADGTLTVSKAPLTVTANAAAKTYDGLAYSGGNGVAYQGFVHSENSSVLGGTLAYGGTSQTAVNTGTYAITPSGLTSGNYTLTFADGTLTVSKAPLTVTANAAAKTYDSLAYSGGNGVAYQGFVHSENSSVLGGTLAYGGTSQTAVNVGSYTITPSGLTSGNYTLAFADGTLTVSKAPLTVTANAAAKTYDGLSYSGGNGVGYQGFVHSENSSVLGGTLAYGGTSQTAVNVGTYTITPSGLTSGNYTLTFADGTLTVSKAPLTVTANSESKYLDGFPYSGGDGASYSGFVHGETASVLGGTFVYGGDSQGAIRAGSYTITASGLTAGNYALTFVDGVLKITQIIDDNQPGGGLLGRVADEDRRRGGQAALLTSAAPANAYALPFVEMSESFIALPGPR